MNTEPVCCAACGALLDPQTVKNCRTCGAALCPDCSCASCLNYAAANLSDAATINPYLCGRWSNQTHAQP